MSFHSSSTSNRRSTTAQPLFNRAPLPDLTQPKPGLPLPLETKLLVQANFQYDPNSQYQDLGDEEDQD